MASLANAETVDLHTLGAIGTFHYMSPEQFDGEQAHNHLADIYAVGILLYELLTGQVPFAGDVLEVLWGHASKPPVRPSQVRLDVPIELDEIVLRALSKAPEDRYQSAGDLAGALQRVFVEPKTRIMAVGSAAERSADQGPSPDLAVLVVEEGDTTSEHRLGPSSVVIGRAAECDVVIQDKAVSRKHLRLSYETGGFVAYDLGSSNGTLVNGQRISRACDLRDGDRIQVGRTVLVFRELMDA
jgi:serine/threonine protein kinase